MKGRSLGPPTHFLSHVLDAETPAYGGATGFRQDPTSRIQAGGTANSSTWSFPNHIGTHVDAPRHFFDEGADIDGLGPDAWWYDRPQIVDVAVDDDELIHPEHLREALHEDTDFLLLRTGFEAWRGTTRYWEHNPGLSAALGTWLRGDRPHVRAVGMDVISVTARQRRPEGRMAHRAFLDPAGVGRPILLVEDMALAHAPAALTAVCVAPIRVRAGDGGPCTVLAWSSPIGQP